MNFYQQNILQNIFNLDEFCKNFNFYAYKRKYCYNFFIFFFNWNMKTYKEFIVLYFSDFYFIIEILSSFTFQFEKYYFYKSSN